MKRCRPDLETWRTLCARYTQHELAQHLGKGDGVVANWARQLGTHPIYACDAHGCGYRGPREDFVTYRRCKVCQGGKRRPGALRRLPVPVKVKVKRALLFVPPEQVPFTATPGRLSYWARPGAGEE